MSARTDPDDLFDRLARLAGTGRRHLVALAGAPGSGKSTLAEALLGRLEAAAPGCAAILPMDGFHYDDLYLAERGWLARKGAPHTFDTGGLLSAVERLSRDDGAAVAVPVFDRSIEIARAGARVIAPEIRLILVEGNYLLLDDPAWRPLRPHFVLTVYLDVPDAVIRTRLLDRWRSLPLAEAERKVSENDLPNARTVIASADAADLVLASEG